MRALSRAVSALAILGLLPGCSGAPDLADAPTDAATQEAASNAGADPTTLTVLAAASLTEVFAQLADQYETEHPEVTITLSFGSSTTLAQQIAEGAPADLYASAGRNPLEQLPKGYADQGGTEILASNVLEIAVQPGNPESISGLEDFTRGDIDTVLCADTVPCGRAADQAFTAAGVTPTPASRELDVKATLAKIVLGEADAAIVYRSDVVTAEGVEGVEIPPEENVTMPYPLVWFNTGTHTVGFAEFLAGPTGRAALTAAGFSTSVMATSHSAARESSR